MPGIDYARQTVNGAATAEEATLPGIVLAPVIGA